MPAIKRAKQMGLRVVAVDRDPRAPGLAEADHGKAIDVTDVDGVIRFARECQVNGAMTMQSDLPVATVAAVCQSLGLSGISPEAARWCTNKVAMRRRLSTAGVRQPDFRMVLTADEAVSASMALGLPVVVKSPESSGSRGVTVVREKDDVLGAYHSALEYSPSFEVVVENFVEGVELGAQTLSLNGRCELVLIHDDEMTPEPAVVPIGHSYPADLGAQTRLAIEKHTRRAVEALGVTHGPANVDLIVAPDGVPYVIEIGARIGATCLPELTTLHTGFDWVEASIHCALGETPEIPKLTARPVAARVLTSAKAGQLRSWTIRGDSLPDGIVEWGLEVAEGDLISPFTKGPDRIGRVMAVGKSVDQAFASLDAFVDSFEIVLDDD